VFPNEKLNPAAVTGMGFLLGDKKPGPFKLEVDSIRVGTPQAETQRDLSLRNGKSS